MDWKKTFNRGQWLVHFILASAVIVTLAITIFTVRFHHFQNTEEERILKINSHVNYFKTDLTFEKMGKLIGWMELSKANDMLKELTKNIIETEEILEYKSSKDLNLSIRNFHKLMTKHSEMSNPADALKVLKNKIERLKDFAEANKYKTVSAVASKMFERIMQLNPKTVTSSIQVTYLISDVDKIESVVSKSLLKDFEKENINSKLSQLRHELDTLTALNSQNKDLRSHVNQGAIALATWSKEIEKKSKNMQGLKATKQNQLILMLSGLVAFFILSWVGFAYLFRWQKEKISDQVESEVKKVIEDGILGDQRFMVDHYSEHTREKIVHLLDDLKLKLNLGSLLHHGLPFAGCMVDTNFKVVWSNQLFLDQFYLSEEEVSSDAFNWGLVKELLNLEQDPIYEAIVNKIAGIYPVKFKQDDLSQPMPYEMYVTPIMANREDRVMIFFYPLVSIKESIQDQVNLSKDVLRQFSSYLFSQELSDVKNNEFENICQLHDLKEIYDDLYHLKKHFVDEKSVLQDELYQTQLHLSGANEIIRNLKNLNEEKKSNLKRELQITNDLKEAFIKSVDRIEQLVTINRNILKHNDDLKSDAVKMKQYSVELVKKSQETAEIINQLESTKNDYKKLKLELLEIKAKLVSMYQSLSNTVSHPDETQVRMLARYQDELIRLDFNVVTLDKKLTQLDILLVKLQMTNESLPTEQSHFNLASSQKDHELKNMLIEMTKEQNQDEGLIIDNFKNLHQLMKKDLSSLNEFNHREIESREVHTT